MLGGYGAAKHGLVGLSSSLRAELAPFKIKVVLIEPGAIKTPIWNRGLAAGGNSNHPAPRATPAMPNRRGEQLRWQSGLRLQGWILPFRPRSSLRRCRARILHLSNWSAGMPGNSSSYPAAAPTAPCTASPRRGEASGPDFGSQLHVTPVYRQAEGVLVQVLLVIILRVVEVAGRRDLGRDPPIAGPVERRLELITYSLSRRQLLR